MARKLLDSKLLLTLVVQPVVTTVVEGFHDWFPRKMAFGFLLVIVEHGCTGLVHGAWTLATDGPGRF